MSRNQYPPRIWDKENGLLSCGKCSTIKPYSEFSPDKSSKSGYGYWCKNCASFNSRKHHRETRANNPLYKEKRRDEFMQRQHGISLQQYLEKLASQDYLCAICKVKLPTSGQSTHLDHNHSTGKLRDFLCTNCNRGLGHFQDNPQLLEAAKAYLDTHNSNVDAIKEGNANEISH